MKVTKVLAFSLASTAALTIAGFGSISARAAERGCNNNVRLTQSGGAIRLTPVEPDYYCDFDFDGDELYLDFVRLDPGISGATKFILGSDADLWEEGADEAYYDFRSANYSFEVEGPVGGFSDDGLELTIVDSDVPELVFEGSVVARQFELGESEFGLIQNNATISSGENRDPAIFTIENSNVDRFVNNGFIGDHNRQAIYLTNYYAEDPYYADDGIRVFENYGHIFSQDYSAVYIKEIRVDNFLNYARIESTKFQPLLVGKGASIINFHVSPLTRFVSAQDKPVFWSSDANAGALKKIVFGGSGSDPKGDVDDIEKVIFGNNSIGDFTGLKTWQVGGELGGDHDDDDVVWEFGGEGAYGEISGATIDIVRGTARLASDSDKGFGPSFETGNGEAIVRKNGALDLNGLERSKPVAISNIELSGGAGSGTVQQIMASTARIHGGALTGTITSKGGLISGVTGAHLNVESGRTFLRNMPSLGTSLGSVNVTGGQLWAADDDSVSVANLTLDTEAFTPKDRRNADRTLTADVQDGLVLGFDDDADAALEVTNKFAYEGGNVYLYKPAEDAGKDYEGTWNVIEFSDDDLSDQEYEELFANTYLMYEKPDGTLEYFRFDSDGNSVDADLLREVTLKKGSLKVEVGELNLSKPNPDGDGGSSGGGDGGSSDDNDGSSDDNDGSSDDNDGSSDDNDGSSDDDDVETIEDEIEDEIIDEIVGGDDFDPDDDQDGDAAGDGGGTIDLDDGSLEEIGEEFEIFTKEELVGIVTHGLLPLNVDGPGQMLATYNNVLADTIFERIPMRQFTEVEPEVAVEPTPEPEVIPAAEPVQGLWSKETDLDDQEANAFLAEQTASMPLVVADAHTHAEHQSERLIELNGKSYAENESLTAEYTGRDGVRGWFRGFGSNSADSNGESSTVFNPFSISSGGGVVGVDVSLSETFQLGAYANYGNTNLWQRSGVKGMSGSWESDGWGGGVTADYWSENFYVQGLIGGTGFSGQQKRSIKGYGAFFDDQTASGEKSATSVVGALRLGAPFQSGSTYFEPQFTATWTGNNENRFSESTSDDQLALTYKSRTTNYLQTALGMKVAWPMKTGTTGLLTPSVKVAWLGDWDMGNEDQKIGFDFTNKGYSVSSNQENVNGALIEAGLDYSVAKVEGTTVKAYLRGGAEVWGGERGTQWRASGGVTFQF